VITTDSRIAVDVLDTLLDKDLNIGYVILFKNNFENMHSGFEPLFMSWNTKLLKLKNEQQLDS
jgi:hypothetical protein